MEALIPVCHTTPLLLLLHPILLSTADGGMDDILVLLSTIDRGMDDISITIYYG